MESIMNWLERRRVRKLVRMTDRAIERLCADLTTSSMPERSIIMLWLDELRDLRTSLVDARWRRGR